MGEDPRGKGKGGRENLPQGKEVVVHLRHGKLHKTEVSATAERSPSIYSLDRFKRIVE